MPQKFLSIKDCDKYQHYKQRNPPWVKVYRSMLGDPEFMKLPIGCKYLYVGLIILASECDNRVLNDRSWIAHRLSILPSEVELKPLYKSGFLLASDASIRRYHQESREEESREETEEIGHGASAPPSPKVIPLRGSILPEGFQFDARAEELARGWGLNPHKEFSAFRDHHTAKGTIFKDWQAAFRNWLRNSVKFSQRNQPARPA